MRVLFVGPDSCPRIDQSGRDRLVGGDRDYDVVAERRVDVDMQAEAGDPAVLRVPIPVGTGAAEEWVQRVDRRLPEAKPVAQRADNEGDLQSLPIVIGLTPYGRTVGLCRHTGPWSGGLPRITLAPKTFAVGRLEVTDVLLHEMIHAKLTLAGLPSDHNSRPWCAEVERLSPAVLGTSVEVAPVVPRRVDGKVVRRPLAGHLDRKQLAGWPQSLRAPAELDSRGRPIPVPTC
jgi:hypothetical protein